jgi:hypothetical protein
LEYQVGGGIWQRAEAVNVRGVQQAASSQMAVTVDGQQFATGRKLEALIV